MTFDEMINNFSNYNKASLNEGCSSTEIEQFENINNVKLPIGYKKWLRFFDGGELFLPAGIQLYGIKHNPIIDVFDDTRPSSNYIVIGVLSSGDTILTNQNDEKISIYNVSEDKIESDEIYDDFDSFFKDLKNILGENTDE